MSAEQLAREARRHGLSVNDLVAAFNSLGDEIHERTVSDHIEMVRDRLRHGQHHDGGPGEGFSWNKLGAINAFLTAAKRLAVAPASPWA